MIVLYQNQNNINFIFLSINLISFIYFIYFIYYFYFITFHRLTV